MIFIESTIKISNNISKMDSTIVLYRGDKNIEIRFTILQSPFKYSNTVATNVIESTNASFGQLVIKTPNDKPPIFSDVSATKEGTVLFTITKEMIDEIEEVGVYTFQIRLLDENKQSRGTIPPVENGIEIKEPIAIEDDNSTNVVGLAKANYAVATLSDVNTPAFDDNGKYNKTNWNDGDIITNASLNKIEDGIYTTNENVTATKKYVDDKVTVKTLPVDYNKNYATNVADLEPHSIYMSPNDAKFLYLAYEKLSGSLVGFLFTAKAHGRFIYTGVKDDTKIEIMMEGSCYTVYFKTDTVDAHVEKTVFYLTKNNTTEFTPSNDYEPATKKYVDDNRDYYFKVPTILYDDPNLPKGYVDISTLETGTNYRVNSSIVSGLFKVSLKALNDDGTWFTVDDGSNTIGWSSMLSTSICVELKSDTFIGINMSSINNYCKYLSITKENGKWKLMQTKLNSISPDNIYEYEVSNDYNPAHKKYVDDNMKTAINDVKGDLGTDELTTTAKDLRGAVNELNTQCKDIANKTSDIINILAFKKYVKNDDDWTEAFQKAIDLQETNLSTIYVPSKKTPYKIGKLYIKNFLSIRGDNNYWGDNIHSSLPSNDSVIITTQETVINSKPNYEATNKAISITNLSFDSKNNNCTFFNDLKLSGSYIYNNRFRSYSIFLYGELNMLSTIEHNLFLDIAKNFMTYKSVNLTDSRIINNYINGSTASNEVVMFDLITPNQSFIQNNFIDYCKIGFKVKTSIGLVIDANDIQLCSVCFDLSYPSGLSITNNRIRWIQSAKKTYWTDRGTDVTDFGINNEWVVFKINDCTSMTCYNNYMDNIDLAFLFTDQDIKYIRSHGNMYKSCSTLIKNNMPGVNFAAPYGIDIDIEETKLIKLDKQPTYVRDEDRIKYFKGYKCIIDNVEYTNWDDGILFKNPLGKYNISEDLFTTFELDNTYNYTTTENNKITITVPSSSATKFYWIYTKPINIQKNKRYYIVLDRDISFEYHVFIEIKYNSSNDWQKVGLKSRHNDYDYLVDNITADGELRISIAGEKGKTIIVGKPIVKEIL